MEAIIYEESKLCKSKVTGLYPQTKLISTWTTTEPGEHGYKYTPVELPFTAYLST
jgi:hypothetical protein